MFEGSFFWRDNWSADPKRALAFYQGLFGWSINPQPMGNGDFYNIVEIDGAGLGGVAALDPTQGASSHWIPYIGVNDVDATVAKVEQHGGVVRSAAVDIPEIGRLATIADPTGAHFVVMSVIPREDAKTTTPGDRGTVAWNELASTDVQKALDFYERVFGYTHNTMPLDGYDYYLLRKDDENVAGLMPSPPEMPFSAWTVYFEVEKVDAAQKLVTALGGKNETEVMDAGGFGRFAIATDPAGAHLALFQGDPEN